MDAETWFTAEQAVDNGFADRVNTYGKKAAASGDWKLGAFANAPRTPAAAAATPEPAPAVPVETATDDHRARQQQRIAMLACLEPG
jgi:ATP-dependent Clp protease protease subunit